ncbi:unnamed protein product [Phytophthora lilii]|uniref:Unnamed protein product n=1 Tax=Phytophthora lilii TaxID=2077276 RepID=A0A9W6TJ90_9STRA|nr:unnamed protein product [Phytophthora lilii]
MIRSLCSTWAVRYCDLTWHKTSSLLSPDKDGSFFFDRDFWVFRLILLFLRDNKLPDSVEELRELYCEASFYRVGLLRHAIEARMIGEDAMAASVLQARPSNASAPSPESTEKEDSKAATSASVATIPSKYNELPDPFGFTSKNLGHSRFKCSGSLSFIIAGAREMHNHYREKKSLHSIALLKSTSAPDSRQLPVSAAARASTRDIREVGPVLLKSSVKRRITLKLLWFDSDSCISSHENIPLPSSGRFALLDPWVGIA